MGGSNQTHGRSGAHRARLTLLLKCKGDGRPRRDREERHMLDRLFASAPPRKPGEGQTFVEYALILAVVVVAVLLAVTWTGLGTAIQKALTQVSNAIRPETAD